MRKSADGASVQRRNSVSTVNLFLMPLAYVVMFSVRWPSMFFFLLKSRLLRKFLLLFRGSNVDVHVPAAIGHPAHAVSGVYARRNIVSTVNLGCPLDLKFIALQARNAEYNPKVASPRQPH